MTNVIKAVGAGFSNFSRVLAHQPARRSRAWLLPNESIRLDNIKTDPDYVKIQQLVIIKTLGAQTQSAYCMSHKRAPGQEDGAPPRRRSKRRRAATT